MEDIYDSGFKLTKLDKKKKKEYSNHNITFKFPVWLTVVLHICTVGIFSIIYFGIIHGKLPKVKDNDPGTTKAILFWLIPFYNIYWYFFFWGRLVNRINFQLRLNNKNLVSEGFMITTLVVGFFPYLSIIALFILMPIVFGQLQQSINIISKTT